MHKIGNSVVILVGVPGSGKSTVTEAIIKHSYSTSYMICSADNYFMKDGVYQWEPAKIGAAHSQCKREFEEAIIHDTELIIVDNTNIKHRDRKAYIQLGLENGYRVFLAVLTVPNPEVCAGRNVHGVPLDVITRMASSLDVEPGWYEHSGPGLDEKERIPLPFNREVMYLLYHSDDNPVPITSVFPDNIPDMEKE